MLNSKLWISRITLAAAAAALALNLSAAHALVISATTTFDDVTVNDFSFGPTTGSFSLVSGGTSTTATFSGDTATTNPLSGPLTDAFDGSGFTGSASASNDSFAIGFDTVISVLNDTASTQTVVFRLDYSNMVNADGGDAYADSELTLDQKLAGETDFSEIYFSDLLSDTFFGDEVGGVATGQSGETLMDSGVELFTYMLNPSDQIELKMSWTLEGGDFLGGQAEANLSADLTIVPLPGAFLLMLSGLLLLPLQRLMRKYLFA